MDGARPGRMFSCVLLGMHKTHTHTHTHTHTRTPGAYERRSREGVCNSVPSKS